MWHRSTRAGSSAAPAAEGSSGRALLLLSPAATALLHSPQGRPAIRKMILIQTCCRLWQGGLQLILHAGRVPLMLVLLLNTACLRSAYGHVRNMTVCCEKEGCSTSRKLSSSSSALSMRSAYSPMIQTMAARASGSSKLSRLSHSVAMIVSYLPAQRRPCQPRMHATPAQTAQQRSSVYGDDLAMRASGRQTASVHVSQCLL